MRRLPSLLVLCAWLLASGAQWDVVQGVAWVRMAASYSRNMPIDEALRMTFRADNLCGVCEFVADNKTRSASRDVASDSAPAATGDSAAKGKLLLAASPVHVFIFASASEPEWPAERFDPLACGRAEPPTEPPRAA